MWGEGSKGANSYHTGNYSEMPLQVKEIGYFANFSNLNKEDQAK